MSKGKRTETRSQGSAFQSVVCWDQDRAATVLNTEALDTSPSVFLATHYSMPLFRVDITGVDIRREYHEEQLVRDLFEPPDFALVAVLGGAGTGKSHLIRWVAMRIQDTPSRRVVLIPRAGTSLYEVVGRILEGVEGERFEQYRHRLSEASTGMTVSQARVRLLQNLTVAVGEAGQPSGTEVTPEEEYLSAELPQLLGDVVFREHFLKEGGVLDRLARRVTGADEVERVDERREFKLTDLPLNFRDVNRAAKPAQEIYRALLGDQNLREGAVRWLNRHLDRAISDLMKLTGTDLLRLMRDVRIALAQKGVELVILIEDLATLQGLDQQLLEALIIKPRQEGMEPLCALRTAIAMTTGYYEALKKNIRQRFDFRVTMDEGESDARGNMTSSDVHRFVAGYLNATRLRPEELAQWFRESASSLTPGAPPSACSSCPYRFPCHKAFGSHDGIGVYPLSDIAIDRIGSCVNPDGFNPRTLLKEGLKPVLENYAPALHDGSFPPPDLLARFGKTRLSTAMTADLRRDDPINVERRKVLLDMWSDATEPCNLDPIIHEAFGLPMVPKYETTSCARVTHPVPPPAPVVGPMVGEVNVGRPEVSKVVQPQSDLQRKLGELDVWHAGGELTQDLTNQLRSVVYAAVVAHLDWDAENLVRAHFAGGARAFRQGTSINFARQHLQPGQAHVRLTLPLRPEEPADCEEAGMALQGLLQFKERGDWAFPSGGQYYRAYLRQVDSWTSHVVQQVKQVAESSPEWDPVPAAIEMLAIGALVSGRLHGKDPEVADIVSACLDSVVVEEKSRAEPWRTLAARLNRLHGKVREVVISLSACSKGAATLEQVQVVDAGRMLNALNQVREKWMLQHRIPAGVVKSYSALMEYQKALEEGVTAAITAEGDRLAEAYKGLLSALGLTSSSPPEVFPKAWEETAVAIRKATEEASGVGMLRGRAQDVEAALGAIGAVDLKELAGLLNGLGEAKKEGAKLSALGAVRGDKVGAMQQGLAGLTEVLRGTSEAIARELDHLEAQGGGSVEESQRRILSGLAEVQECFAEVQVDNA